MKQIAGIVLVALVGFGFVRLVTNSGTASIRAGISFTLFNESITRGRSEQLVVAHGIPTADELKTELNSLYHAFKERHPSPTNLFIFIFGSKEQAQTDLPTWIGLLSQGYYESDPEITISKERLAALSLPPQNRFGISEATRKKLYYTAVKAEDRAALVAVKRVSDPFEQEKLKRQLRDGYKKSLTTKYGVTADQLAEIEVEGYTKGWPVPPEDDPFYYAHN